MNGRNMCATIHPGQRPFVRRGAWFRHIFRARGAVWREKKDVEANLEKRESFLALGFSRRELEKGNRRQSGK